MRGAEISDSNSSLDMLAITYNMTLSVTIHVGATYRLGVCV